MSQNANSTEYDDVGNPVRSTAVAVIAAAAGTTAVKNGRGRAIKVVVTTAGTATDNATIYDGPASAGVILGVILGGTAVGTNITIDLPFATNLTVVNVTGGPGFSIGYC